MTGERDESDVFAIPDFWRKPQGADLFAAPEQGQAADLFDLIINSENPADSLGTPCLDSDSFFKLPAGLPELPRADENAGSESSQAETVDDGRLENNDEVDPWLLCTYDRVQVPELKSWDLFEFPDEKEQPPLFLTEAGPTAYDSFLALKGDSGVGPSADGTGILDYDGFCACLLSLALGRSSILFSWSPGQKAFIPLLPLMRVSGYSAEVLKGIVDTCNNCGTAIRFLRDFVDTTYVQRRSSSIVALANAIDKVLVVAQSELGARGKGIRSLLRLQAVVTPVRYLASYFRSLVAKLSDKSSDEKILEVLFEEVRNVEYRPPILRDTVREVLKLVSGPWLRFVQEWIGLSPEEGLQLSKGGPGKGFIKTGNQQWSDELGFDLNERDYVFDEKMMPRFIPVEIGQDIFETGKNLRFLRENHSHHPLSHLDSSLVQQTPKLEWQFEWEAIKTVEAKAVAYERALMEAIQIRPQKKTNTSALSPDRKDEVGDSPLQFFGWSEEQIGVQVLESIDLLGQPVPNTINSSNLNQVIRARLYGNNVVNPFTGNQFSPHWSLLPVLSFGPLVSAQSHIISIQCLRLLFSNHDLRGHLDLLKDFALFGNGVFSSRLSHALFDADIDATERKAGVVRSGGVMGLRLGGRDSWPPASSELRLALMGVLTESYSGRSHHGKKNPETPSRSSLHELPGDLSFAVRELTPEEMERCMDPDSIEALDFLRLSYKPPAPLLPIMTPAILLKYDRIFILLLRVLRMLYTVNQVFADVSSISRQQHIDNATQRFQMEAHQFVYNVAAYFFDTGIEKPWRNFETLLDKVQVMLETGTPTKASQFNYSPNLLRDRHELVVDEITRALLLRKRQQPVLQLLEDIFRIILQFAKSLRFRTQEPQQSTGQEDIGELYSSFRKKVEVFLTVCKGMSEKTTNGAKQGPVEERNGGGSRPAEDPIVKLLLMLDISNYYSRRVNP